MVVLSERAPVELRTLAPVVPKVESVESWTLYRPDTLVPELMTRVMELVLVTVTEETGNTGKVIVEPKFV